MEAKFLASVFSFLSIFLAIYAQSLANDDDEDLRELELPPPISYYGDANVNLGESFEVTCIIPVTYSIDWTKDDEPITRHNLRHGRDEHSYVLSESPIEGEKHKIEAHIKVRHALKVHDGRYQCNKRDDTYHTLHVHTPIVLPKPRTKSPFIITAGDVGGELSTESGYEPIYELTPSSPNDLFTRTWESPMPARPAAPTTPAEGHHRQHHRQHQHQLHEQLPHPQKEHKFIHINASNFDGAPRSSSASGSDERATRIGGDPHYHPIDGLIELEYMLPAPAATNKYGQQLSTIPWQAATRYPPPPQFPPPRTTMLSSTQAPPSLPLTPSPPPPLTYYTPTMVVVHPGGERHHHGTFTANNAASSARDNQMAQVPPPPPPSSSSRFPLHTLQPAVTTHHNHHNQHHLQQLQMTSTPAHPPVHTIANAAHPGQQTPRNPFQQYSNAYTAQPPPPLQFVTNVAATAATSNAATTFSLAQPNATMPIKKEPQFLVPNYDNAEHELKTYDIRQPLVLSCNITQEGNYVLKWEKNGTDVSQVRELEGRYRIIAAERKFIIDRTDINDDGLYSCSANNEVRHINVVAHVVVRVPSNSGVVEGEKLSIVCAVVGTNPQLSWSIGNMTISNSTGRYILKPDDNKIENAVLSVENVSLNDRGEFKCIGRNVANDYTKQAVASDVSYVRVKGKLAALWPFLGICAEVLILCAIILIYEKRRNKTELEESDTDPQEQYASEEKLDSIR